MTFSPASLLTTDDLNDKDLFAVLDLAKSIKSEFLKHHRFPNSYSTPPVVALLFFEASTRTRVSFEMAALRLNARCLLFDGAAKESTSLSKGETLEDTFWVLHAMRPDLIVIRSGAELDFPKIVRETKIPILNAGYGAHSHPTQALLDVMTMQESLGALSGKKVLFVGDIHHSRVASSHQHLLHRMGAEMAVVGPEEFVAHSGVKKFHSLKEALPWADVVVGLRVQLERHSSQQKFSKEEYIANYQINKMTAALLKKEALLLHPGPVNWGVEFSLDVTQLPQFRMWQQKENGVYLRAALLQKFIPKRSGDA